MISPELLADVGAAVRLNPSVSSLRPLFPALHFSECSADDINARFNPVFDCEGYELYLISGASGHCLELTSDFNAATGIIVAAKSDD
ncbi:DUF6129 family protein [Quatrionicoccus australiensis]|uniref:DUF6129 family protein n=1 Tax=Quatrionicoccus australiensis TaxID=138118 RepID=UPI001CFA9062|nr:DUF6129 family protein [Quatrionicoccus australiensis]MCB4360957.1 hypothetical protein [Quatrionicoccus australiensis]